MLSSDRVGKCLLEEWPPLRIEKNLVVDPVRNGLLADGGMTCIPQPGRNSSLTSGDLDSFEKSSNVRLIHEHRKYTRFLVPVNKDDCLTVNKAPCNVVTMQTAKRKTQAQSEPARKRIKVLERGPDGRTFPQRLGALMAERGIGQTELARRCSELYSSFFPGAPDDKVKQQHIFNATGTQATSEFLPLIAVVLDVNELWLQFGVGPKVRGT
jgi:hypothetical protein